VTELPRTGTGDANGSTAMTEVFLGTGVALVTIFSDDGEIDPQATSKLAADLVARGIRGVVVAGSTGEAATLTERERVTLIDAVRGALPADIPVIAGTGAPSARQAAALTADAVRAGADALLTFPPPGSRDLPGYYAAVAGAAAGRPVLAYHFPRISAPGVPVEALAGLPVVGVKDSSGDPNRLLDELAHYPGAIYVGSAALLALAGPMGAAGAILALANIEPERCVAAFAGDAAAQLVLADRHLAVQRGGPAALKAVLAAERGTSAATRA
jgi:4-hydroxy-tetrahydrodipicolinate synthase